MQVHGIAPNEPRLAELLKGDARHIEALRQGVVRQGGRGKLRDCGLTLKPWRTMVWPPQPLVRGDLAVAPLERIWTKRKNNGEAHDTMSHRGAQVTVMERVSSPTRARRSLVLSTMPLWMEVSTVVNLPRWGYAALPLSKLSVVPSRVTHSSSLWVLNQSGEG